MTFRGRLLLGLGVAVYAAGWALGSRALYPVAAGLVLAVGVGVIWVRLALHSPRVRRVGIGGRVIEGDDVRIELVVEATSRLPPPTLVARERAGRLGERRIELARAGRGRYAAAYELSRVPRGRHAFADVRLSVADPFGLARAELVQGASQALVVHPRLVPLRRLFDEGGAAMPDGRGRSLPRAGGVELHGVREHERGEPLRSVHWRSTARRGRLMVKELEDAPRDDVAVLLDGDPTAAVGEPPDSSFDAVVRAAGSILRAHVERGRRCALVVNQGTPETQRVGAAAGNWRHALDLLAAAEPTARLPASALLGSGGGPLARALALVVVTARADAPLVETLLERVRTRRLVSLVFVDPVSFAGGERPPRPALLRLQAAGVRVAVVRRGDDLAAALSAHAARRAAHA